jgi:translocation and assembly module TamB
MAGTAVIAGLLSGIWLWSGSQNAVPQTLRWAQYWLRDSEGNSPLTFAGAKGSLRHGGEVAQLSWHQDRLNVTLTNIRWVLPPGFWTAAVLKRDVQVDRLDIGQLKVQDERPTTSAPLAPPETLALPWLRSMTLPLALEQVELGGKTALTLGPLKLSYLYGPGIAIDGQTGHQLEVHNLRWAEGNYQLHATLLAAAPMTLRARLSGTVPAQAPLTTDRQMDLQADARVDGTLATPDATLQVSVNLNATPATSRSATTYLQAGFALRPWQALPVESGHLRLRDLDLATLWPDAPSSRLHGEWLAERRDGEWRLRGELLNQRPGPWDKHRLPLERMRAELRVGDTSAELTDLYLGLADGQIDGKGAVAWKPSEGEPWQDRVKAWQASVSVTNLRPRALLSTLDMQGLEGSLQASGNTFPTQGALDLSLALGPAARVANDARQIAAPALAAKGRLHVSDRSFEGTASLEVPGAHARAEGWLGLLGHADQPPTQARLVLDDARRLQTWLRQALRLADRALPSTRLSARVPAAWLEQPVNGVASLSVAGQGEPPWSVWQGSGANAPGQWQAALDIDHLTLPANADQPPLSLDSWHTTWTGRGQKQTLVHQGDVRRGEMVVHTQLNAEGQMIRRRDGLQLQMRLSGLSMQAPLGPLGVRVVLDAPAELHWTPGTLELQPGALRVAPLDPGGHPLPGAPMTVNWSVLQWKNGRLGSQGQFNGWALSWIDTWLASPSAPKGPLTQAGLTGELLFAGDWKLDLPLDASSLRQAPALARIGVRRTQGDLTLTTGDGNLPDTRLAAGLTEVSAALELQGQALKAQWRWQSSSAGQITGEAQTQLAPPTATASWTWPAEAPLQGRMQVQLPQIGLWSAFAPPGWRMRGSLEGSASVTGTRGQPQWQGTLQARDLAIRSVADGVDFSDGQFLARLDGDRIRIENLRLRGAGGPNGGMLTGSGQASWPASTGADGRRVRQPDITLQLQAQKLHLLARADRRLVLSGQLDTRLQGPQLDVTGSLQADQALFLLPDESTPTLGDDVVVRGWQQPATVQRQSAVQTHVQLDLSLGNDFRVRGHGLDTALVGRLQLSALPGQNGPTLSGQVRTVRGTYRAYGQALVIEEGTFRFNGPYDNPALDILAVRSLPSQTVGVQVKGTARAPKVSLYADPGLPDSETLAWLVLGRPATGAGAEAAILQQAALALLSSQGTSNQRSLLQALGLDEVSYQGESTTSDGTTTAAAVTLGKRVSNQLYVSYSRSVIGLMGTVSVLYDVSRYVTLRAQAGDDNAIDLIFTRRFD